MPSQGGDRQRRAVDNDGRIVAAGLELLATDGWSALTQSGVAASAGLSRTAVASRYETPSAIAVDVWQSSAGPELIRVLDELISGALLPSLDALTQPSASLRAAAELLVSAQYDEAIGVVVQQSLGQHVSSWCGDETVDVVTRARRGYLLSLGLGALFGSWVPYVDDVDWSDVVSKLEAALAVDIEPHPVPELMPYEMDYLTGLAPDDPALNALLGATLTEIAAKGFDAASVKSIARASGYTEGLIFSRYRTKQELFLDATKRQQAVALQRGLEFQTQVGRNLARGILIAQTIRESQLPYRYPERRLACELIRLTWHHEIFMADIQSNFDAFVESTSAADQAWLSVPVHRYYSQFMQIGAAELACLYPDAWKLPYDVVTVPLEAQ